ncbi:MAG: M48 family metallopeptidase [Candidatus Paceibacterota bacterium]|jgi:hypothetical protein
MKRKLVIKNQNITVEIRKSKKAKRMRIAVYCDGSVVAVHPENISFLKILSVIEDKINWIKEKVDFFSSKQDIAVLKGTKREYLKNKEEALLLVKSKVEYFNNFYKFHYNKIYIKNQKTRWGSCSVKKNLNFNYKIIFLPKELQDYLIVHELCHLKEFNHSKKFWDLVRLRIPNLNQVSKMLRKHLR